MDKCIFCKIASGEMDTDFIYKDDEVLAFKDIQPQAPVHILIIPRKHYTSIREITDPEKIGALFLAGNKIAGDLNLEHFRLVVNTGSKAGQSVFHLHLHLLGGREMNWPPG